MEEKPESTAYEVAPTLPKPKLTRACNGCIKAKRKCSYESPQCARCRDRNLTCKYENQPLVRTAARPAKQVATVGFKWERRMISQEKARSIFDPVSLSSLTTLRLPMLLYTLTVDDRSLIYLKKLIKRHPISFNRTTSTTFIHPEVPLSPMLGNIRKLSMTFLRDSISVYDETSTVIQPEHLSSLQETIIALVSQIPTLSDYVEVLQFVQGLILIQILTLFVIPAHLLPEYMLQQAHNRQSLLHHWTRKLYESAPSVLPAHLTAHQAYAFAESVRRTLIVSNELKCIWTTVRYGYFINTLYAESLPFDRRMSLWNLTNQEFEQFSMKSQDESNVESLVQNIISYKEYCEMYDRQEIETLSDSFDAMLLVGAKGIDSVEKRFKMILN